MGPRMSAAPSPKPLPFRELTARAKFWEIIRWIAVFPTALLAQLFGLMIFGMISLTLLRGLTYEGTDRWIRHLTGRGISTVAFVVAGAMVAPRCRRPTAVVLAMILVANGVLIHWIVHRDSLPVVAEAAAVLVGVAIIYRIESRRFGG